MIGAGLAGLRAALEAKQQGAKVAVLSKLSPARAHSATADGGIHAALDDGDDWRRHAADTIHSGDYLADQDAVERMCQEAAQAVSEMERWGCLFSRRPDGRLAQHAFGGHGQPRACYAGERIGRMLHQTLYEQALRLDVEFLEEWFVLDVVHDGARVLGLVALELLRGTVEALAAPAVICAAGGAGLLYAHTGNPWTSTGDGQAVALRAGVALKDMEFVQFQPLGLYPSDIPLPEGARTGGGTLRNACGERFMTRYAARLMEAAPSDVVTRAIRTEIREGRGLPGGYVELDIRHLGATVASQRLQRLLDAAKGFAGLDAVHQTVPVRPIQNAMLGGIATDIKGSTTLGGLYAAGEAACVSVHGAHRLDADALLAALVFGRHAGRAAAERAASVHPRSLPEADLIRARADVETILERQGSLSYAELREQLRHVMDDQAGPLRTGEGLKQALAAVRTLRERFRQQASLMDRGRRFNTDLRSYLEARNLMDIAEVVVLGALRREESRGVHARRDFGERNDTRFLKHTLVRRDAAGALQIAYAPVAFTAHEPLQRRC